MIVAHAEACVFDLDTITNAEGPLFFAQFAKWMGVEFVALTQNPHRQISSSKCQFVTLLADYFRFSACAHNHLQRHFRGTPIACMSWGSIDK